MPLDDHVRSGQGLNGLHDLVENRKALRRDLGFTAFETQAMQSQNEVLVVLQDLAFALREQVQNGGDGICFLLIGLQLRHQAFEVAYVAAQLADHVLQGVDLIGALSQLQTQVVALAQHEIRFDLKLLQRQAHARFEVRVQTDRLHRGQQLCFPLQNERLDT